MAKSEETGAAVTEWSSVLSSPRGLFSAFVADGYSSRPLSRSRNGSFQSLPSMDAERGAPVSVENCEQGGASGGLDASKEAFGDWKPPTVRNGASIAERRAARCGFSAPRINTARFRSGSPVASPGGRSPYLTIPPGLSPTSLLDSPVMLPNSQAQPSPTTGSYPLPSFCDDCSLPGCMSTDTDKQMCNHVGSSGFIFKPHQVPVHPSILPSGESQVFATSNPAKQVGGTDIKDPSLAEVSQQMDFEYDTRFVKEAASAENCGFKSFSNADDSKCLTASVKGATSHACIPSATDPAPQQHEDPVPAEDEGCQQLLEEDQKGGLPSMGIGRPSEDGYNWRKYGQKQVKGSEYPRSYYKCTHPNCQVKKKVERSHDGQITEIIYKGAHNHPKPQPSRRSGIGSTFSLGDMSESLEGSVPYARTEAGSVWRGIHQGSKDNGGGDWKTDGLERTSSTSVLTDVSDPLSTAQGKQMVVYESADTIELSSTLASHDDDEDIATQGSMSLGDDVDDDESESKRRKKDCSLIEMSLVSRSVREPRVVVQTDSEVDILDDGYRWRKYGQKVVKGNPNPRSYYKCTNAGCTVRKHVERASHDLKSVITTYEGKHNHEVPAARNSNHINSGGGTGSGPPNAQTASVFSVPSSITKPEQHAQDVVPHFDRKPEVPNEYLKSGYLGGFTSDIKLGSTSCYDMKLLPSFQAPFSLGSFGQSDVLQTPSVAHGVPDFPLAFPSVNFHRPGNFPLAGFDFNPGKSLVAPQPFIAHQSKEGDSRLLRPKQEQKDEYESQLPIALPQNTSYRQIMGGFPI